MLNQSKVRYTWACMPTFKNPKQKRKGSKVLSETRTIEICLRTSMQDIGYTELCIAFFSSLLSSS